MKYTKPFKRAIPLYISQGYHKDHKALDFINPILSPRGYGTPLVAPERVRILDIRGDALRKNALKDGNGIYMLGLESGTIHLYWHTLPIHPVNVSDEVERGKIVAYMGNAGYVRSGGKYVPIKDRNTPGKPGTHLHWSNFEKMANPTDRDNRKYIDFTKMIDWNTEPHYGALEVLKKAGVALLKMSRLL